jgi:sporulation protein YlmC with PRC-barrel domain
MDKITNRTLLLGSAFAALAAFQVPSALAQDAAANPQTNIGVNADVVTETGVSADAGKLIGKDVLDANGKTVGEIDSVIVNTQGKVTSVVLDVSGWLETAKLISVPWTDLKSSADGKITASISKEQAQALADYKYQNGSMRGTVLSEAGGLFDNKQSASTVGTGSTTDNGTVLGMGTPIQNADGSMNASQVIGLNVRNNSDDSIGKISELVVNQDGKVQGVVVDVGGFLGIGAHPVMLKWNQVKIGPRDGSIEASVDMTKDTLKQMPAYNS